MAYRGKYQPKNPSKYLGDPTKITYRSLWERKCMLTFDDNPNVIRWASEEIAIPYLSPVDKKRHRYFPDFIVEVKNKKGETVREKDISAKRADRIRRRQARKAVKKQAKQDVRNSGKKETDQQQQDRI